MDRSAEINKLVNVLRRTARLTMQAEWTGSDEEAAAYAVEQYNRVLARLTEMDPDLDALFAPLASDSPFSVTAMACRQLAAYYEDEVREASSWQRIYGAAFDPEGFKDFWRKTASDIEDLGDYLRESIDHWARAKHSQQEAASAAEEPAATDVEVEVEIDLEVEDDKKPD